MEVGNGVEVGDLEAGGGIGVVSFGAVVAGAEDFDESCDGEAVVVVAVDER